jgi:hypothetical protein
VADWSFLTDHTPVLLGIAHDPGVRLRYIAARTGVTERTEAGDVVKHKDRRRNRCQIQARVPLYETGTRERAIGEVLALLLGNTGGRDGPPGLADAAGRASWTARSLPPARRRPRAFAGSRSSIGREPHDEELSLTRARCSLRLVSSH